MHSRIFCSDWSDNRRQRHIQLRHLTKVVSHSFMKRWILKQERIDVWKRCKHIAMIEQLAHDRLYNIHLVFTILCHYNVTIKITNWYGQVDCLIVQSTKDKQNLLNGDKRLCSYMGRDNVTVAVSSKHRNKFTKQFSLIQYPISVTLPYCLNPWLVRPDKQSPWKIRLLGKHIGPFNCLLLGVVTRWESAC